MEGEEERPTRSKKTPQAAEIGEFCTPLFGNPYPTALLSRSKHKPAMGFPPPDDPEAIGDGGSLGLQPGELFAPVT